jgi:hypothetical protein
MTTDIVCDGEFCNSVFKDRKELFKMKRLNEEALFCFGCVAQINKEDGWEMKSRDSLARYEKIAGEEFVPYEDLGLMDNQEIEAGYEGRTATEDISKSLNSLFADERARVLIKMLEDLVGKKDSSWPSENRRKRDQLIKTLESLGESKITEDS